MAATAANYIQRNEADLSDLFEDVKSDSRPFRKATYYDVTLGDDIVRFNVMDKARIPSHIEGLLAYISSLDQDESRKYEASNAVSTTQIVIGLKTEKEFDENYAVWESLFTIVDKYDGLVFVYDSILLPNGAAMVGPLLDYDT